MKTGAIAPNRFEDFIIEARTFRATPMAREYLAIHGNALFRVSNIYKNGLVTLEGAGDAWASVHCDEFDECFEMVVRD